MFELTYIHHDCFLMSTPECGVVFDYWFDPVAMDSEYPEFLTDFPVEKPLYVLVSHFHKDHFNKVIFKWVRLHRNIRFIVSRDVARQIRYLLNPDSTYAGSKVDPEMVTVLSKLECFSDPLLTVQAFGSTDIGNSYAVTFKTSGLKVFHAGDLNCWTWRDESTPEEIRSAEKAFSSELRPIADAYPQFDVVMFPVDSRLGTGYAEGARTFVSTIDCKRFFPMHFTLGESHAELEQRRRDAINFSTYAAPHGEYIALTEPYDTYSDENPVVHSGHKGKYNLEHTETYFLSAGDTDAERELSLTLLMSKIIEISTTHANNMEIGNPFMPNDHCGWVLSRVSIEMKKCPIVDSTYRLTTWVEEWNRHYSVRAFCVSDASGNPLGYARTIWMVLDTVTHANAGLDSLPFRKEYLCKRECPIPRQTKHLQMKLAEELTPTDRRVVVADPDPARYTFLYCDLDAYRHVNTVRYVTLLMNQFTLAQHDASRVRRVEFSFLDEGAYGMTVEILRSRLPSSSADDDGEQISSDKAYDSAFLLRDAATKNPIFFAKVFFEDREGGIPSS